MKSHYLSAKEVTAELGISIGTLYSYVSRGLIRSEETEGATRHKRYLAEDVAELRSRKDRRRNPTASAATALDFGDPVLESAVTLIDHGRLYYRGQPAVELARRHTAEEIAGFLWNSRLEAELAPLPTVNPGLETLLPALLAALPDSLTPVERFHLLLPIAEAHDLAAHDKSAPGVCRTAGRIYGLWLRSVTGAPPQPETSIAQHLASWRRPGAIYTPDAAITRLFDAALILCADHELNASSFTARCVASTGATPYGAVAAGLAALQGPRHGGDTARCEMLLREAQVNPRQALAAWVRRGESLPGFGHRLYPNGDPRARFLLDQIHGLAATHLFLGPMLETVDSLCREVAENFRLRPNIDLALATISLAFQMPNGAGLTLFTSGRLLGWIAHILEQYQIDGLIRPRARYTGPMP